jgi:hypothetical protein
MAEVSKKRKGSAAEIESKSVSPRTIECRTIVNPEFREARTKKNLQFLYDEAIDIPECTPDQVTNGGQSSKSTETRPHQDR